MKLTVGSVFSGVGGFDLGFEQAGCGVRWQIEINGHCAKVLNYRWPAVKRFADVNALVYGRAKNRAKHGLVLDKVDILCGGFPCQDLSIAGKRKGLRGARSGLFFAFMRAVRLVKPRWVVIENVPGLLTSHDGRDFHTVLATLAQCGMRRSYRILDSQHFKLAQRRERVFIVGHSRAFRDDTSEILFEPVGRDGDSAPGQAERPRVAATLRGRSHGRGVNAPGRGGEDDVNLIPFDTTQLTNRTNRSNPQPGAICHALSASAHPPETLVASALTASAGHHGHSSPRGDGNDNLVTFAIGSHSGTFNGDASNQSHASGGPVGLGISEEMSHSLRAGRAPSVGGQQSGVRRLTPLECERLQGFPDGWTCLCGEGHRGTQFCICTDSARYKALGNAVSVPVAKWIASRIVLAAQRSSVLLAAVDPHARI